MPRVDTEFADTVARALEMAGWSVSEAARLSGVPYTNLEQGRNANRHFSPADLRRLILALLEAEQVRAAWEIANYFKPGGCVIQFAASDQHNNLATFRDEMEQASILWRTVLLSYEDDGRIDLNELAIIERLAHIFCGMVLDQCRAERDRIYQRAEGVQPTKGIAGYAAKAVHR